MEIRFHNNNVEPVGRPSSTRPPAAQVTSEQDQVAIENARALRRALDATPPVRPEVVEHASLLVGDVNYPPPETIQKISHLLALRLQSENDAG